MKTLRKSGTSIWTVEGRSNGMDRSTEERKSGGRMKQEPDESDMKMDLWKRKQKALGWWGEEVDYEEEEYIGGEEEEEEEEEGKEVDDEADCHCCWMS